MGASETFPADTSHWGDWWEYAGYSCRVLHGTSYECPALKLYGYATDRHLHNAIRREVKKRLAHATAGQ